MLADSTQGGIPLGISALEMTTVERRAAIEVLNEIREKQKEDAKKKQPRKKVRE